MYVVSMPEIEDLAMTLRRGRVLRIIERAVAPLRGEFRSPRTVDAACATRQRVIRELMSCTRRACPLFICR